MPAVLALSDTLAGGADTGLDTYDGEPSGAVHVSEALSDRPAVLSGSADTGLDTYDGEPSGAVHVSEALSDGLDSLSDTSGAVSDTSVGPGAVPDPLTIAVELVRNDRQVAGSRIAAAMRRHGHTVTDRTGLRWRDRAVNHLAAELTRDLSDASTDDVRLVAHAG
jgi:hypothetical protein